MSLSMVQGSENEKGVEERFLTPADSSTSTYRKDTFAGTTKQGMLGDGSSENTRE